MLSLSYVHIVAILSTSVNITQRNHYISLFGIKKKKILCLKSRVNFAAISILHKIKCILLIQNPDHQNIKKRCPTNRGQRLDENIFIFVPKNHI